MFLANMSIDYSSRKFVNERLLTKEQFEELRTQLPELNVPEYDSDKTDWYPPSIVVDDRDMEMLTRMGFELDISKVRGVRYPTGDLDKAREATATGVTIVSVPNIALYEVQRVTWMEDACTQAIQEYLNNGWRILAICPANDQRRPDYILGHRDQTPEYQ